MEKIKWSEKITEEKLLERVGEKRTLSNNILRRKVNRLVIFGEEIAFFMMPLKDR